MQIIHASEGIDGALGPSAVGIGIFDGVHLGHQALLREVVRLGQEGGHKSVAYTFHPHPAAILNPSLAPKLIESIETRLERFASLGLDVCVIEPFSRDFAQMPPEVFVREVLSKRLLAQHVVVGGDFTFGHKRGGNVASLIQLGATHGFAVHPLETVQIDGMTVSSTKIREFIWAGTVRGARLLLGRPYSLTGLVIRGAGRGRLMGFPTANVQTHAELIPAKGVYAVRVSGPLGVEDGVVNIGVAPTFGDETLKIEAHLYDYKGEPLYGLALSLEFIDRIRDEQRFDSLEALQQQITEDIATARELLAAHDANERQGLAS